MYGRLGRGQKLTWAECGTGRDTSQIEGVKFPWQLWSCSDGSFEPFLRLSLQDFTQLRGVQRQAHLVLRFCWSKWIIKWIKMCFGWRTRWFVADKTWQDLLLGMIRPFFTHQLVSGEETWSLDTTNNSRPKKSDTFEMKHASNFRASKSVESRQESQSLEASPVLFGSSWSDSSEDAIWNVEYFSIFQHRQRTSYCSQIELTRHSESARAHGLSYVILCCLLCSIYKKRCFRLHDQMSKISSCDLLRWDHKQLLSVFSAGAQERTGATHTQVR